MNFACKLKLSIILSLYAQDLTDWEETFIEGIKLKNEFTPKQVSKMNEIWKTIRTGKRNIYAYREPRQLSPYSEELGLAYDDVHDFDK